MINVEPVDSISGKNLLKYLLLKKGKKFFWFDKLKFINIYSFKEYIKN